MAQHSVFQPSAADRTLHCPPSLRLNEKYPNVGSTYTREGTDAHTLCEHKVKLALGIPTKDPREDLDFYDAEMEECAQGYANYILGLVEDAKQFCEDPVVLVEQRLDFSQYVPGGFGTGDCVIVADDTLNVVDFKYGKNIVVSAEENPQMMIYALGALSLFDFLYDIRTVTMTIYQPRREHISTYTLKVDELEQWARDELVPKAKLALAGEGEFSCGDWCVFCRAKNDCRKRAERNLELARYDFEMPPTLTDEEVEIILGQVDELVHWANDIKAYALKRALDGYQFENWKLVEGRSNRKYTDENIVAKVVKDSGFDPYEKKVLGITAMEKMLGKAKFRELLSGLVEKPAGKPTLVPRDSDRKEISSASMDFQ